MNLEIGHLLRDESFMPRRTAKAKGFFLVGQRGFLVKAQGLLDTRTQRFLAQADSIFFTGQPVLRSTTSASQTSDSN